MVSQLSATKGARVSTVSLVLAICLLALSLTGNPGVTGPVPAIQLMANGVGLVVGAAWLVYQAPGKRWPPTRSAIFLLSALSWLSLNYSLAPYLTSLGLASLAGFVGAFLLLELVPQNREQGKWASSLMVTVASLSSVHGLWLWTQKPHMALTSTFTNPDCYSIIPFIGCMLSLGLAVERTGLTRIGFVFSACLTAATLMLTASRAGLIALALGYAGILFTLAASRSAALRTLALKLLLLPTVIALLLMVAGTNLAVVQKWDRLARGDDPVAVKSRWDVLRYASLTALRNPWTGVGLGCFSLGYQQDRPPLAEGEDYMNVAHNDYMQWFVETGVAGGTIWIALLILSGVAAWRSYRAPTPRVAAQIGTTLGISAYCALNFACPVPADFLWLGASLGLSANLARLESKPQETALSWNPKLFPLGLLLVCWGVWSLRLGRMELENQRILTQIESSQSDLDWESSVSLLQPALQRQPSNYKLQLKLAELSRRALAFSSNRQWLDLQEQALRRAYQGSPRDLQVTLNWVNFLQEHKRLEESETVLAQAQAWSTYSADIQRARARNQILNNQILAATRTLVDSQPTGRTADEGALGDLLFLLEAKAPQSGAKFLSEVYFREPDRAIRLGQAAAARARELEEYAVSLRLLKHLSNLTQGRKDILLEIALARGLAGETQRELALLDQLRQNTSELDPDVAERVWRRWSELRVAKGELDLVATELEDYLIAHQRQVWAREVLSEIFLKKGKPSEARTALRDGLPYDQDGLLRVRLGDLCASQGLKELARGYYREALPLTTQRALVEERLKALGKAPAIEDQDL